MDWQFRKSEASTPSALLAWRVLASLALVLTHGPGCATNHQLRWTQSTSHSGVEKTIPPASDSVATISQAVDFHHRTSPPYQPATNSSGLVIEATTVSTRDQAITKTDAAELDARQNQTSDSPNQGLQKDSPVSEADRPPDNSATSNSKDSLPTPSSVNQPGSVAGLNTLALGEPGPADVDGNRGQAEQPVEQLIDLALASHPQLQAARQRVAAARHVVPQANSLPDPTFTNTFWPLTEQALQTASGRLGNQMALNQTVPFPDKLKTKAVIASREIQIAEAEAEAIAREIAESVRLAYYEVWYANQAIAITETTQDLVDDLTKVAEARYRSGGSQQDVLRAELENDRLEEQLIHLQQQKQLAQADLATLLQQPLDYLPETTTQLAIGDVPRQIDSIVAIAEQQNPTLRGLAWEIQRDRDKQRLACLQQYPDFNVGVNWGLISDRDNVVSPVANGHDNLSLSFGTTLPLWREKIKAGVREASHRTASTRKRLEAERDELRGKLRRLIAQAEALDEQQRIYRDRIIPRTENILKLAVADYRGNRTDFFSLIETYRELLMFETQVARIRATLAGTLAAIDRAVGKSY